MCEFVYIYMYVCVYGVCLSFVQGAKYNDKDYFILPFTQDITVCVYTAEEASNATKTYLQALNTNVGVR